MKVFYLDINFDDNSGMDAISLVEYPAVEINYLKFDDEKPAVMQFSNEEKRIITGVVCLADTPIYRNNPVYGEHYVVFKRDMIEKMIDKYSKDGLFNSVNLQHDDNKFVDGIYMVESYIKNSERGIAPVEFANVPDGSWICSYKVDNIELWNQIKNSKLFNGFSLQGMFNYVDPEEDDDLTKDYL